MDSPMPWPDIPGGLRATERYTQALELRFSYSCGNVTYLGTGRTRNLGAGGVCFEPDQDLKERSWLELRISWPSLLQRVCPLELVVRGPLLRKDADVAVLRMDSYEFQTCANPSFSPLVSRGVTCNVSM